MESSSLIDMYNAKINFYEAISKKERHDLRPLRLQQTVLLQDHQLLISEISETREKLAEYYSSLRKLARLNKPELEDLLVRCKTYAESLIDSLIYIVNFIFYDLKCLHYDANEQKRLIRKCVEALFMSRDIDSRIITIIVDLIRFYGKEISSNEAKSLIILPAIGHLNMVTSTNNWLTGDQATIYKRNRAVADNEIPIINDPYEATYKLLQGSGGVYSGFPSCTIRLFNLSIELDKATENKKPKHAVICNAKYADNDDIYYIAARYFNCVINNETELEIVPYENGVCIDMNSLPEQINQRICPGIRIYVYKNKQLIGLAELLFNEVIDGNTNIISIVSTNNSVIGELTLATEFSNVSLNLLKKQNVDSSQKTNQNDSLNIFNRGLAVRALLFENADDDQPFISSYKESLYRSKNAEDFIIDQLKNTIEKISFE